MKGNIRIMGKSKGYKVDPNKGIGKKLPEGEIKKRLISNSELIDA